MAFKKTEKSHAEIFLSNTIIKGKSLVKLQIFSVEDADNLIEACATCLIKTEELRLYRDNLHLTIDKLKGEIRELKKK